MDIQEVKQETVKDTHLDQKKVPRTSVFKSFAIHSEEKNEEENEIETIEGASKSMIIESKFILSPVL
jgi:hypothetical protein